MKTSLENEVLSSMDVCIEDVEVPERSSLETSPTLNGMGYSFFVMTPIEKMFLKKECLPGKRVINIGCGFVDTSIEAVKNGVSECVANDLSEKHLKILVKRARDIIGKDKLSNLKVLCGQAPQIMSKLQGKYDAIIAEKVIHFFAPDEIEHFIESAKSILVEKGRIYVTVCSVFYPGFANDFSKKQYAQNLKDGKKFPGYFQKVMTGVKESGNKDGYMDQDSYKIPEQMILFSKSDLERLFKSHGMKVEFSCSLKIPTKDCLEWRVFDEENYDNPGASVGIIAEKL